MLQFLKFKGGGGLGAVAPVAALATPLTDTCIEINAKLEYGFAGSKT